MYTCVPYNAYTNDFCVIVFCNGNQFSDVLVGIRMRVLHSPKIIAKTETTTRKTHTVTIIIAIQLQSTEKSARDL